ncbi:MAG TPA: flagellar basal body rod protein FlgB [Stellaceae bacterium]|jgi:flagellar basal-body rod protein FlgB
MDIGRLPLFEAFSKRMSWLTARQTVLAENVANANTPDYVAKDVKDLDFGKILGTTPGDPGPIQLAVTQPDHIAIIPPGAGDKIVVEPEATSLDGNGVSLEEQMMKVSTNAASYALVTTLYKQNVGMIKSVLGGS